MDKFELLQKTADVIQERGDSYGDITECHESPDHTDSWQDIIGYTMTGYECANAKE